MVLGCFCSAVHTLSAKILLQRDKNMGAEVTCGGRGVCVSWECLKLCSRIELLVSSQPIPGSQDTAMAWKQPEAIPLELPLLCVST